MLWTCAHEQIAHGQQSIGVANKNTVFVTLVGLTIDIIPPGTRRYNIYGTALAGWQTRGARVARYIVVTPHAELTA